MPSGKNDYEFIQYYDVNDPEFLSELQKNSTFFEEISSYTETSPTDEYTHNTYYFAEATRWIPLTVQYVCAHCEQINTDYRQFLTAKGKSGSSSSRKAAMSPERKMEARRKLDANVQSVLENFRIETTNVLPLPAPAVTVTNASRGLLIFGSVPGRYGLLLPALYSFCVF